MDYVRNKLYSGVSRETSASLSLGTQTASLVEPPQVRSPGLVDIGIGKVKEPKNVGEPCATVEVRAEGGTQANDAAELLIVF